MNKLLLSLVILLLIHLTLAGCDAGSTANRDNFKPIRPDPTSTPSVVGVNNAPTPVVSVDVAINTYVHPSHRFSLNYPANWQYLEQPQGVILVEPGDQAGYSVMFQDVGEKYSSEELNRYLVTYVAENFAGVDSQFTPLNQKTNADGTVVAQFTTQDPNLGQVINEVRVKQQDTIVLLVLLNVTEEQWQISQEKLQALADSVTLLDSTPLVEATPTAEAPSWILIGSTNQQFGFLYPSDWEVARQAEDTVVVTMPDYEVTFEGAVSAAVNPASDPATAAEKAAHSFVDELTAENKDVQSLPPGEFPLDRVTGVTIDFLYTTPDGTEMAGSVITAASHGKIYRVAFTAPAEFYQAALQWFNPMYKSFKILKPEEMLSEQ